MILARNPESRGTRGSSGACLGRRSGAAPMHSTSSVRNRSPTTPYPPKQLELLSRPSRVPLGLVCSLPQGRSGGRRHSAAPHILAP